MKLTILIGKCAKLSQIATQDKQGNPIYPIMVAMGICHLFNDTLQSIVPAMFPILKDEVGLTFTQLGFISFALNMVASLLQPVVGFISDKKPMPYALPLGMVSSFIGVVGLAFATDYCGVKSGRDIDKAEACGLTPVFVDGGVTFEQAEYTIVCRKMAGQFLDPSGFIDPSIESNYSKNDYHKMYIGEILKVYKK